jgi:hypothetical protein
VKKERHHWRCDATRLPLSITAAAVWVLCRASAVALPRKPLEVPVIRVGEDSVKVR